MSSEKYLAISPPSVQALPDELRLSLPERLFGNNAVRKGLILIALAFLWEVYARHINRPLLFPTFSATIEALFAAVYGGELISRVLVSLKVLSYGYASGVVFAALLASAAVSTRLGNDLLELLTSMFNPLPAIALFPLALLWFGLGTFSISFVVTHAVLWPTALSTLSGFNGVSNTLRMVGRNYGLSGWRFVSRILIPAAFPSILTGLKVGWAFAWRTLIASELVFGVSSQSGGLGWFIYENKNQLEIASVFAGLLTVILIGIAVENLVFRTLEERTVRRWGMQN